MYPQSIYVFFVKTTNSLVLKLFFLQLLYNFWKQRRYGFTKSKMHFTRIINTRSFKFVYKIYKNRLKGEIILF